MFLIYVYHERFNQNKRMFVSISLFYLINEHFMQIIYVCLQPNSKYHCTNFTVFASSLIKQNSHINILLLSYFNNYRFENKTRTSNPMRLSWSDKLCNVQQIL